MYYDIIQKENVDEHGNKFVELCAVTVPPQYDDIEPKDMSLENQKKAGVQLQRVTGKNKPNLESSDKAEASIFENGSNVEFVDSASTLEPTSEPTPEPTPEPIPEPKSE